MALAVEPPVRRDLSCRDDDDKPVAVLWLKSDATTPVEITSATVTLRFDLPDDSTWETDPETEEPIEPARQTHVINGTSSPGDAGGWIVDDDYATGQILAVLSHQLWSTFEQPWAGSWDLVAVSVDSIQRCLARGRFACEEVAA